MFECCRRWCTFGFCSPACTGAVYMSPLTRFSCRQTFPPHCPFQQFASFNFNGSIYRFLCLLAKGNWFFLFLFFMRLSDSPTEGAIDNGSRQLLWGKSVYLFCCLCATRIVSFLHCLCKSNKNGAYFHITAADSHWTEFGKTSADNWHQLNTVHYWETDTIWGNRFLLG